MYFFKTKINKAYVCCSVLILMIAFSLIYKILTEFDNLIDLNNNSQELQFVLNNSQAKRLYLENKVMMLQETSLDLDLIDELARQLLGYSDPNELVYKKEF